MRGSTQSGRGGFSDAIGTRGRGRGAHEDGRCTTQLRREHGLCYAILGDQR